MKLSSKQRELAKSITREIVSAEAFFGKDSAIESAIYRNSVSVAVMSYAIISAENVIDGTLDIAAV